MLPKSFKAFLAASIMIQNINAATLAIQAGKCVEDVPYPGFNVFYCALSGGKGLFLCDEGSVRYKLGLW